MGLELTSSYFRGSAVDTSGNPHARPGNTLLATLRLDRRMENVRAALRFSYGRPGVSLTGEGLTITDGTSARLFEVTGTVGFRVGGLGPSGAVEVDIGPTLHSWKVSSDVRTRVGGLVAGTYEWPVSTRFTGAVRIEGTLSQSWFDAGDLPPEYERQVTWRFGWGVGLRYGL
ncbi:MAG: hypothetical protein ACRET3_14605 [Burkholderiales bacterium]